MAAAKGDLTAGAPGRKLLAFALPILVINLLQAVYNVADMVILGQVTGAPGMSAVGIGGQVTTVVLVVVTAIANGGAAIMGRYFGAGNRESIKRLLSTMLSFTLIVALVLTAAVIAACRPILRFLNTPAESFDGAVAYLIICMCGTVVVYAYNAFYAVLRAIGESAAPMRIMLLTTAENIVLDLLFIGVFHWGVWSAAFATTLAQTMSCVLCFVHLTKKGSVYSVSFRKIRFHGDMLRRILRYGMPAGIQNSVIGLANVIVQTQINSFAKLAMAAYGSQSKIEGFAFMPITSFSMAITTFISQNLGAQKYDLSLIHI